MRKIYNFRLFESKNREEEINRRIEARIREEEELMGKLLHLYGSIPLPKEKATIVIKKIMEATGKPSLIFGQDIDLSRYTKYDHDRVRFKDYYDSLVISKDSRGHNFEGTLCGLFNGELSKRGEKWDITLNGKTWSVKFTDNPSKAPEIGSFKNIIINNDNNLAANDKIFKQDIGSLRNLFKSNNTQSKEKIFNLISNGITGGWILAYSSQRNLILNIVDVDTMKKILIDKGMSVQPKGGREKIYSLAISSKYRNIDGVKTFKIGFPDVTLEELRSIYKSENEEEWGQNVFGDVSKKIRPDVIRYIKNNSEEISNRLKKFKDFKD